MNPAADYFTATMPEPWQILGLRLQPFPLGHYKLLKRHGCAFVSDTEQSATRADLLLGVLCCSMPVEEFEQFIEQPDFQEQIKSWGNTIGLFDLNSRAEMFKQYIEQQSQVPKYWEEKEGGVSGAHWAHCLEVTLRAELGWTAQDLNTQPLSKAFADYFKHAENQGMVKLMTPEEIAFIESQKKEVACGS